MARGIFLSDAQIREMKEDEKFDFFVEKNYRFFKVSSTRHF